jgi:hypothetical protein
MIINKYAKIRRRERKGILKTSQTILTSGGSEKQRKESEDFCGVKKGVERKRKSGY